jgi:hypothetical protein
MRVWKEVAAFGKRRRVWKEAAAMTMCRLYIFTI